MLRPWKKEALEWTKFNNKSIMEAAEGGRI
jgi:hypothetical protein